MRHVRTLLLGALTLCLGTTLVAHEETYLGTVMAIEPAKIQVKTVDPKSKKETPMHFSVTAKTKVLRGDKAVPFRDARIQKDERVSVTINNDEDGHEALIIRLAAQK